MVALWTSIQQVAVADSDGAKLLPFHATFAAAALLQLYAKTGSLLPYPHAIPPPYNTCKSHKKKESSPGWPALSTATVANWHRGTLLLLK